MVNVAELKLPSKTHREPAIKRTLVIAVAAMFIVALLALLGGALYSAAFGATALSDPGAVVRWGLATSTTLSELFIAVTSGALFLAVFAVPGAGKSPGFRPAGSRRSDSQRSESRKSDSQKSDSQKSVRSNRTKTPPSVTFNVTMLIAGVGAACWTVTALARLLFSGANTIGVPLSDPQFGELWLTFITKIPLGQTLATIMLIAALVTTLCFLAQGPITACWTLVLTCAAFAFLSSMGHAAGGANHMAAVSAMLLHLGGAAIWIGALVAIGVLYLVPSVPQEHLAAIVARYSAIAAWCFVLVAVSGLVNALIRVGSLEQLGTEYGVLVLAKTLIFVVLGGFGWLHRKKVVSRLGLTARGAKQLLPRAFWQLAAAEIVLMGAVSGVAVALGGTTPPISDETPSNPTPAYQLTGYDLPPEPTFARWFTEWRFDVLFAFLTVAGLVTYWRWVVRLRKRGDKWSWLRTASWTFGMIIMFWVTSGGPAVYGKVLFSSHMIMHMALAMVIPIFLVSAAPVTLLMRAIPARKDNSRGPREWLLGIIHSRYGQFFSHPIVAAINFAGSMIIFYFTPAFDLAMSSHVGHLVMIVHFTMAGYFFANALIGIDPGPNRPVFAQRLVLLLATMAFHAFFGVSLMGSEQLLAADWFGLMGRPWGESAIEDQQRGGGFAWGIGEIPTIILAMIVAVTWSQSDERAARRRDRQVEEYGDSELEEYNRKLAEMAQADAAHKARENRELEQD